MANALGNIGSVDLRRVRFERTHENGEEALANGREIGDRRGEIYSQHRLGLVASPGGRVETPPDHLEAIGTAYWRGRSRQVLGTVERGDG